MSLVIYWLLFSSYSVITGLTLSAFNFLNVYGYITASVLFIIFLTNLKIAQNYRKFKYPRWNAIKRRGVLYWSWLSVSILCLIGGVINPPSNYDGVTYRLPRLLYWLQDEGWHWIGSINDRMDYSSAAQEWQFAPFFALGFGDRLLFIVNFIPYLLLPTLIFKGLLLFKCKRKWSWYAMWTFPLFSGFVMQSASIGNDFIGAWLAVAAIAILHTNKPNNYSRFVYSALAIGLLSGMKASNLPLYLPLGFVWLWQLYLAKPDISKILKISGVSLLLALCVSFAPTAVLNYKQTGDPFGAPNNNLKVTSKVQGILGNSYLATVGLIELPINPFAKIINTKVNERLNDNGFVQWINKGFPRFTPSISYELPAEEASGTGLLFSVLLVTSLFLVIKLLFLKYFRSSFKFNLVVFSCACVAVLAYSCMLASESAARLLMPYYLIVLLPLYAIASQSNFFLCSRRSKFYRFICVVPALLVLPGVLLTPNRPLVPISFLKRVPMPDEMKQRLVSVYETYKSRNNLFINILPYLEDANVIMFAGNADNSVYSLLKNTNKPVFELGPVAPKMKGTIYIVASNDGLLRRTGLSIEEFTRKYNVKLLHEDFITSKVGEGPVKWAILRMK